MGYIRGVYLTDDGGRVAVRFKLRHWGRLIIGFAPTETIARIIIAYAGICGVFYAVAYTGNRSCVGANSIWT